MRLFNFFYSIPLANNSVFHFALPVHPAIEKIDLIFIC